MTDEIGFIFKKNNNRKALLLFHGLTGSPLELKQYAKKIHREGYDIYCPTLPGHGQYMSDIKSVNWESWLDFSLNHYLNIKNGYDDVYVGGICLGAVIALAIASEEEKISGILALSTTLFLDGWSIPWYKFLFPVGLNTILRYYYSFQEKEPYGIKNPEVRKKMLAMMKNSTVALEYIPLSCAYELLCLSAYTKENMDAITQPCFLAHSIHDDISSIKSAKFVYENISSKIKEFHVFKDSYHLLTMDNEKEILAKKTIDFLNSTSGVSDQETCIKGVLNGITS